MMRTFRQIDGFMLLVLCMCLTLAGCSGDPGTVDLLRTWGHRGGKAGLFFYPRAIAADALNIFVIDRTGRVQVFDHDGNHVNEWFLEKVDNGTPTGMTIDDQGNLWIPDTHNSRILYYSRNGKLLRQFGSYGEEAGRFIYPTDLAIGENGDLYIIEYGKHDRVQVFSPEGEFKFGWGDFGAGADHFNRPMAIDRGPDGNYYIVDAVNHRVKVYDPQGGPVRIFGGEGIEPGKLKFPYDLAFDSEGNLLVSEFGNHRVQKFTVEGKFLKEWGGLGSEPGRMAEPWGVAAWMKEIYVADTKNNRVSVYRNM